VMSEVERTFSDASQIIAKRQNRFWTETIGACSSGTRPA
jgi:hypothetical protein